MLADAILMPVGASMLDRESAAACHAKLMNLPRIASGRWRVAAVGMRIDGHTQAAQRLGRKLSCARGAARPRGSR